MLKKSIAMILTVLMLISAIGVMPISAVETKPVTLSVDGGTETGYDTLLKAVIAANSITEGEKITITVKEDHSYNGPNKKNNSTEERYVGTLPLVIDGGNHTVTTTITESSAGGALTLAANADTGDQPNVTIKNISFNEVGTSTTNQRSVIRIECGDVKMDNVHITNNLVKGGAIGLDTRYYSTGDVNVEINNSTVISTADTAVYTWIFADSTMNDITCKVTDSIFICNGEKTEESVCLNNNCANEYNFTFKGCIFDAINQHKSTFNVGVSSKASNVTVNDCDFYNVANNANITTSYFTSILVQTSDKATVDIFNSNFYGLNVLTVKTSTGGNHMIAGVDTNGNNYATVVGRYRLKGTAEDTTVTKDVKQIAMPKMKYGASVRLNSQSSGIRFTTEVTVDQAAAYAELAGEGGKVEYGTILVLKSALSTATNAWSSSNRPDIANRFIPIDTLDALGVNYIDITANEGISTDDSGNITYRAAITDIPDTAYANDICAYSYVKVTYADQSVEYFYAGFNVTNNTRSIQTVARIALDDGTSYTATELEILNKYAGVAQ